MKDFHSLSQREILALAISLEEEDERVYTDFAEGLRQDFPASAAVFDGMRAEEAGHRRRLLELYRSKFGEHIPLIRRQDVKGFVPRKPSGSCGRLASTPCASRPAPLKSRRQVREDEDRARRRLFVLQIVQPGLAGLMDGSVSTTRPRCPRAYRCSSAAHSCSSPVC
jgi:erythrin-vacuolar iron transport family protein